MGQQQNIPYKEYEKQYELISKTQHQQLLIKHKLTQKQCLLRKVIVNSESELQERLKLLNKRRKIKSEHLLNIVDFKPIKDYEICGNVSYVSLLVQYPFESLYYETLHRLAYNQQGQKTIKKVNPLYFQQHELWSILYSTALALQVLHASNMPHEAITKSMILIDKDGGVKIGDPILLGTRTNYQKVIEMIQKEKQRLEKNPQMAMSNKSLQWSQKQTQRQKNLKRGKSTAKRVKNAEELKTNDNNNKKLLNQREQMGDSVIISPQLISFCQDHQLYYYDKEKSDVYILGALMVELALLENVFSFDIKQNKLKKQNDHLFDQGSRLKQKYSQAFLQLIKQMICIDPKHRPTFSQIIQKIEQFSIQQNSQQSDQGTFKRYNTENENINYQNDRSEDVMNRYVFSDNSLPNNYTTVGKVNDVNMMSEYRYKSGNGELVMGYKLPTNNFGQPYEFNTGLPSVKMIDSFPSNPYQYPLYSGAKDTSLTKNVPSSLQPIYEQSAVKSLFSNRLPLQIKHVQSPFIIPVSNIRGRLEVKESQSANHFTPFHQLNLTESNQKWIRRQNEKQSVVKQKITLFGGGGQNVLSNDQFLSKLSANEHFQNKDNILGNNNNYNNIYHNVNGENKNNERFSLSNFGKIQLSSNMSSIPASVNTSMVPTPRFQNPFGTQSIPKINNEITRTLVNNNNVLLMENFGSRNASPYKFNENVLKNVPSTLNQVIVPPSQGFWMNYSKDFNIQIDNNNNNRTQLINSAYENKKSPIRVSDSIRQNSIITRTDKKQEPYFSNSSVGYTLPKYRPESTSSQILKSLSKQKSRCSSANNFKNQLNQYNKASQNSKMFKQAESFLQRVDSSPSQIKPYNQKTKPNQEKPILSQLMKEKQETFSIYSGQNTVRKNTQGSSKKSASKKYNFYKREINDNLQKIQIISPPPSEQNLTVGNTWQNQSSATKKDEGKTMKRQESKIEINYQAENHSRYVEQKEPNGSIYRGYKLNNQRHGFGKLQFADSGYYEGQFNKDKMQGEGKLYYNERDLAYQGQFYQNCFHGHGVLHNNNPKALSQRYDFANLGNIGNYWVKYDGYFKEDQKSGKCHLALTNGQQFEGFCENNTFEGFGKFSTIDGDIIEGIWRNNVLIEITNETKASKNTISN